jgi:hypothetical protein
VGETSRAGEGVVNLQSCKTSAIETVWPLYNLLRFSTLARPLLTLGNVANPFYRKVLRWPFELAGEDSSKDHVVTSLAIAHVQPTAFFPVSESSIISYIRIIKMKRATIK